MTSATYKYSIKADTGYKSNQSGKITPERHGVVCAVLDGGLSDDLFLLRAAPKLQAALARLTQAAQDENIPHLESLIAESWDALEEATSNSN